VQFEIDANGILHVLARDTKTGRQKIVEMKSAVDVEDSAVQKMVDQSVEHAFEDLAARRWVEAKLKAEAVVAATRKGLVECAAELDADYPRQRTEDATAGTGDTKRLQSACAALDEATRRLADVLMEKATEAWLRKQGVAQ
jgi:molecular chaperone DnaK